MNKQSRLQREAKFISHRACPDCGSSDALAIYSDHTHCFSCGAHKTKGTAQPKHIQPMTPPPLSVLDMAPWTAPFRGLDDSKDVTGFGQHLANPNHHSIAICEGEIDAPSIFQATGGKTIGVSVPNGAQNAANFVKQNLDWFQQFPIIYIATDMDEPGEAAAKAIAELFTSGQARRVVFPLKDANEVLTQMGSMALTRAWRSSHQLEPLLIVPLHGGIKRPVYTTTS